MDKTDRFSLMIEALTEIAEEDRAHQPPPAPDLPTLRTVLADIGPLPRGALFLGMAEDGLPVLLNLYDPIPGPILISADQASGKTNLLKTIARAVEFLHSPAEVQYGVVTPYPDEWKQFQNNQNNAGIYSVQDNATQELLSSLVTWAHNNKGDQQSVLLIIDNLEEIIKSNQQAEQNIRWLLLRGPSRRVWPIITLNANRVQEMQTWLEFFRTRFIGHIQEPKSAQSITGSSNPFPQTLVAGSQFAMREGNHWLNFWVPTLD